MYMNLEKLFRLNLIYLFIVFLLCSLLLVVGFFFKELQNQMYHSLSVTQGSLPKPARVYSGHEVNHT
jgi:hypothetical protein